MTTTSNYIIGKANVMYTLYSMTNTNGHIKYTFRKNISKDLNKVKELYPELKIDVTLRGRVIFREERAPYVPAPKNCFPAGKYANTLIAECEDLDYLIYTYNHRYFIDFEEAIVNRATELGAVLFERALYAPDSEVVEEIKKYNDFIANNETYEFFANSNADEDGYIRTNAFIFKFANFKMMNYNGFYYSLPTINGKAKRIKNKNIVITKFHLDADNTVVIEDFEIVK